MKIEYRKGNLFETDIPVIAHGCNAQGVMGSGVAKIVRDQYPRAYELYRKKYELTNSLALGDIIPVIFDDSSTESKVRIIVNAITQYSYGSDGSRFVSYDGVADCMKKINQLAQQYDISQIAMPQIGAGLGGGDWNVIEAIMESELNQVQPVVYIL